MKRWCALERQGETPRTSPGAATQLCRLVRDQSSSELLQFAVLALCQWLPTGRYFGRMRREDRNSSGRLSCPSCPCVGHETSKHAVLCPVCRWMLLDASERAQCLAEEAAERQGTLGLVTDSPADYARKTFRALRHRHGMSVGALMSLCCSGRIVAPRRAIATVARSLAACSCGSWICWAHGWRPPREIVSRLREDLLLD